MTTIAVKSGIMACDSAWTDHSGCVQTLQSKITRLSSGAVVGEAGDNDSRAVLALLDKVKAFDKMPSAQELAATRTDYLALIVFPNKDIAQISIEHDEDRKEWSAQVYQVNRGVAACGSGGEIALGAMAGGRSAVEAVRIACEFDPNSRPPVHHVLIKRKVLARKAV